MKMNMLRSIVKRSGESMESVLKKKLNKEEAVPSPPSPPPLSLSPPIFSLSVGSRTPPPIVARGQGQRSSFPSGSGHG